MQIWSPQPGPQTELLRCPVEDVMFGGARGGGKSDALLGDWLRHRATANGHARGMLIRKTMPQLEELIARSRELFPALGGSWSAGKKTWRFQGGDTLKMRWLEREADADNYQGHQYTWIGVDEAGTWEDPGAIDKLRATLRSPHGIPCVMRLTANPGGLGHQWLKERYIAPAEPFRRHYDASKRVWRVFIPSRVQDNKALLDQDPGYIDRLKSSGPPWLVRAWLEGDWEASAGDTFFAEDALLEDGRPVEFPEKVDAVFAVIDTALKDSREHDGTAVVYCARCRFGIPLVVLDWDILQIKAALLDEWLPSVNERLEGFARQLNARNGNVGMWIEDKASGTILIQQAIKRGLPVEAIDTKLTAMGKEERALSVSAYHYGGHVKISRHAYDKVVVYKDQSRNHFLSQVCGFHLGQRTGPRDLLDCYTYSLSIALGNSEGY